MTRPRSARLALSPLWLLVALLTTLGVNASSAAASAGPETRVRAIPTATTQAVGQSSSETPSGVGCLRPPDAAIASGSCVATNIAPLSDEMAATFRGSQYTGRVLGEDTVLYRAGTANEPLGQFFSAEKPVGVMQTRIDKAIPPVWPGGQPAPLDKGFAVRIPAGTTVYDGVVANQGGWYMGGTGQIVVQKPWTIPGVKVLESWPLK